MSSCPVGLLVIAVDQSGRGGYLEYDQNRQYASHGDHHVSDTVVALAPCGECHQQEGKQSDCDTPYGLKPPGCLVSDAASLDAQSGDDRYAVVSARRERQQHDEQCYRNEDLTQRQVIENAPYGDVRASRCHVTCYVHDSRRLHLDRHTAEYGHPDYGEHAGKNPVHDQRLPDRMAIRQLCEEDSRHRCEGHPEHPVVDRPPLDQGRSSHFSCVERPHGQILYPITQRSDRLGQDAGDTATEDEEDCHQEYIEAEVEVGEEPYALVHPAYRRDEIQHGRHGHDRKHRALSRIKPVHAFHAGGCKSYERAQSTDQCKCKRKHREGIHDRCDAFAVRPVSEERHERTGHVDRFVHVVAYIGDAHPAHAVERIREERPLVESPAKRKDGGLHRPGFDAIPVKLPPHALEERDRLGDRRRDEARSDASCERHGEPAPEAVLRLGVLSSYPHIPHLREHQDKAEYEQGKRDELVQPAEVLIGSFEDSLEEAYEQLVVYQAGNACKKHYSECRNEDRGPKLHLHLEPPMRPAPLV